MRFRMARKRIRSLVQQGNPQGPLLFFLALHVVLPSMAFSHLEVMLGIRITGLTRGAC